MFCLFLLRFYVYLRTEVVSAHLLKSMLFESRCWRLFFTLRKYINGVLGYAKRFVNFLGMYRRKRYGILQKVCFLRVDAGGYFLLSESI